MQFYEFIIMQFGSCVTEKQSMQLLPCWASPGDTYWVLYRFYNTERYWVYPILPISFVKNTIQYNMVQYATIFAKKTFVGIVYKLMIMKDEKK